MKRLATLALAAGISLQAHAIGKLADISVVDRNTGAVLAAHYYRGEYWVAGQPGARYAIRIRNVRGERLLAVTAVDGVNVLSGDTAGWGQSGYVFDPWQGYDITGWRKSNAEVAAFEFTAAPNSYASRTGRPQNVGVIGVALFRERAAPPVYRADAATTAPLPMAPLASAKSEAEADNAAAGASRAEMVPSLAQSLPQEQRASDASRFKLGTGHGQRESSFVQQTEFERLQNSPNEVIRIRYDSLENLMAMGVIRRTPPNPGSPNAFPDSPLARYVPDPPGIR
jgi:hypothetical protein